MIKSSHTQKKALFLDRDGVINQDKDYVHKIEDFIFIPGIFDLVKTFKKLGYLIIIITNQSGIGRGYYTITEFNKLNDWMIKSFNNQGLFIDDVYFCPHKPDEGCLCRKPKPGMILKARDHYNIDLSSSLLIGDNESDILAGQKAGIDTLILVRSGHQIDEKKTRAHYILNSAKEVNQLIIHGQTIETEKLI